MTSPVDPDLVQDELARILSSPAVGEFTGAGDALDDLERRIAAELAVAARR